MATVIELGIIVFTENGYPAIQVEDRDDARELVRMLAKVGVSVNLRETPSADTRPLDPNPWVVHSIDAGDIRFATEKECWAGYRANFEPEPQYNQNRAAYP